MIKCRNAFFYSPILDDRFMKKHSFVKAAVVLFTLLGSLSATAASLQTGIDGAASNQDTGDNLPIPSPLPACHGKLIINSFEGSEKTFNKPNFVIENTFKFIGPTITVCANKGEVFQVSGRFGLQLLANTWPETVDSELSHELCVKGIEPRSILRPLRFQHQYANQDSLLSTGHSSQTFSDLDYFRAPVSGKYEIGICASGGAYNFGDGGTLHLYNSMISALRINQLNE